MRINHYISSSGICSRRKADELILSGAIKVNSKINREPGLDITDQDSIEVCQNGHWQKIILQTKLITYAVYKPVGYTSTSEDKFADHLVIDLVPKTPRVYSIGRLDKDSEGLILLTNDGELANRLTHPSHHVPKTYIAVISIPPKYNLSLLSANLSKLESGVIIDGKKTAQSKILLTQKPNNISNTFEVKVILTEGRNRQIRKMFQKIGLNVLKLTRSAIGKLELKTLNISVGEYKVLGAKELSRLN